MKTLIEVLAFRRTGAAPRPPQDEGVRLGKAERETAVLTGHLPPGAEELLYTNEYRLAAWISGPGR